MLALFFTLYACAPSPTDDSAQPTPQEVIDSADSWVDVCAYLVQAGATADPADQIEVYCLNTSSCEEQDKVVTTLQAAQSSPCEAPIDDGFREDYCEVAGVTYHAVTNCWGE